MQDVAVSKYLSFDTSSAVPLYRQIHARVREAVDTGMLRPGDRIPATRVLAEELGLARGTVAAAYALLSAEGYLDVRGAAGSVVARRDRPSARARVTPRARPLPLDVGGIATPLPFQMGLPALDAFPRKVWARMAARAARTMQAGQLLKESSFGAPALRTAVASYLKLSRGIDCQPSQVFITPGYREGMGLIARALLAPGDIVWTEEPGFPPTRHLLDGLGYAPRPVPVDEHGMDVARAAQLEPAARMAVVTPGHQSPLTMSMPPARRQALLDWADAHDAWIVEDDYDGEFRHSGRPLPALANMDHAGRVVYAGTFSKVMFPALRLSYVVAPPALVEPFEDSASLLSNGCPTLTQGIMCEFMQEGYFVRHVQAMRRLYAERCEFTAQALAPAFGQHATILPQSGGLHLVAETALGADRQLAARLREHGLAAQPLADFFGAAPTRAALLLNFVNVTSPLHAGELARRVARALDQPIP